jgi:hypothetical protein
MSFKPIKFRTRKQVPNSSESTKVAKNILWKRSPPFSEHYRKRRTLFMRKLFVSQGINGIQHGRFSCRIETEKDADCNRKSE